MPNGNCTCGEIPPCEGECPNFPQIHCLNEGPDCKGKVEYHHNPDRDDFKTFPRCEFHQRKRLDQAEQHMRKYPQLPPSDFDPSYAGERWEED